jgi:putative Mg2+ transporter-C (MgtC) family protein
MTLSFGETCVRLLLAAALGALVGLERDMAVARGAGARTHALVALGSAVFTLAGAYGFADLRDSGIATSNFDPARVAAQVATGVGFIGAGAILRHGTTVLGITTAATVWLAAATGVLVAAGATAAAVATIGAAIVILVVLGAAKPLIRRIGRGRAVIEMEYERGHGTIGPCLRLLQDHGGQLENLWVDDDRKDVENDGIRSLTMFVILSRKEAMQQLLADIGSLPEVRSVRLANANEW